MHWAWGVVLFIVGGMFGMALMALMAMAGRQSEHEREQEEARDRFKQEYAKWS